MRILIGVLAVGFAVPAALAQVQLQDGTFVQPGVIVGPSIVVIPSHELVAQSTIPVDAVVYVQRESDDVILPTKGPIKSGGPRYHPSGKRVYGGREINR